LDHLFSLSIWSRISQRRPKPGPERLAGALLERYDRQIRLLKSVKYWYRLPPYVGLLIGSAGVLLNHWRLGMIGWRDFLGPAAYTAFFAFVW
jgi:hypothetical protein